MIYLNYLNIASRSQVKSKSSMNKYKIIGYNEHHGVYDCTHAGEVSVETDNTKSIRGFEKYEVVGGEEAAMRFSLIAFQIKHLLGEVLTTVEATIPESRQQSAVKSIIKNQFHSKLDWIYTQCGYPAGEDEYLMEPEEK